MGLRRYVDLTIATIDAGLFVCLAQSDASGSCNPDWNADTAAASRDICQAAVGAGVALELNNIIAKGDVIIVNCGMAYHGTSCGS